MLNFSKLTKIVLSLFITINIATSSIFVINADDVEITYTNDDTVEVIDDDVEITYSNNGEVSDTVESSILEDINHEIDNAEQVLEDDVNIEYVSNDVFTSNDISLLANNTIVYAKNIPVGSTVRYGKYDSYYMLEWEVLEHNHSGYPSNSTTLWGKYLYGPSTYGPASYYYEDSNIRSRLEGWYTSTGYFNSTEKSYILNTSLPTRISDSGTVKNLQNHIFILSAAELGAGRSRGVNNDGVKFNKFPLSDSATTTRMKTQYNDTTVYNHYLTRSAYHTSYPGVHSIHSDGQGGYYYTASSILSYEYVYWYVPAMNISGDTPFYLWSNGIYSSLKEPTSFRLDDTNITLCLNQGKYLYASFSPSNTDRTVRFTSSNPAVATVDYESGHVEAIAKGETIITATAANGLTATCKVTVVNDPTDINISLEETEMIVGESKGLSVSVIPSTADDTSVTWLSSDSKIVSVSPNGKQATLKALNPGTATITAKTINGKTAKCTVKVTAPMEYVVRLPKTIDLSSDNNYINVKVSGSGIYGKHLMISSPSSEFENSLTGEKVSVELSSVTFMNKEMSDEESAELKMYADYDNIGAGDYDGEITFEISIVEGEITS